MRENALWRRIGFGVVICAFAAAILILLPWSDHVRQESWETRYNTYDFTPVTKEQAMEMLLEATRITLTETPEISAERAYQNFKLVNLFAEGGPFADLREVSSVNMAVRQLGELNVSRIDQQDNRLKIRDAVGVRREADLEFRAIDRPQETIWHWEVLGEHASRMLPFSFMFVLIGLVGLLRLWGFAKLVNVAGCTLSFLFSVAGGAIAQTVKKAEGKKGEKTSQTLQIDARASLFVTEGPPNPNFFLRLTNVTPKGLVESISTWNPHNGNWSTEVGGGIWIPNTGTTQIMAGGSVSDDKAGGTRVSVGTQIYRPNKWGFLAIPILRYERSINGPPQHTFAALANPNIRIGLGRFTVAPDVGVRKTQGRPWSWSVGAALRFSPGGGGPQFETGVMGNRSGSMWMRPRMLATVPH